MSCKAGLDWEERGDCQEKQKCPGRVREGFAGRAGAGGMAGVWESVTACTLSCSHGEDEKKDTRLLLIPRVGGETLSAFLLLAPELFSKQECRKESFLIPACGTAA